MSPLSIYFKLLTGCLVIVGIFVSRKYHCLKVEGFQEKKNSQREIFPLSHKPVIPRIYFQEYTYLHVQLLIVYSSALRLSKFWFWLNYFVVSWWGQTSSINNWADTKQLIYLAQFLYNTQVWITHVQKWDYKMFKKMVIFV